MNAHCIYDVICIRYDATVIQFRIENLRAFFYFYFCNSLSFHWIEPPPRLASLRHASFSRSFTANDCLLICTLGHGKFDRKPSVCVINFSIFFRFIVKNGPRLWLLHFDRITKSLITLPKWTMHKNTLQIFFSSSSGRSERCFRHHLVFFCIY